MTQMVRTESSTDVALLAAACDGDSVAFRVLYERYADQLRRYHVRRCRDDDVAYDLLAETFAQAWFARRSFRDVAGGTVGPWLYGIARNVLRQSVRRQRLEDQARQRLGLLTRADRPEVMPDESWLDGADELLDALPAAQREALELRVLDDLPFDRVASRLQISPENARVRVHRALRALRVQRERAGGSG